MENNGNNTFNFTKKNIFLGLLFGIIVGFLNGFFGGGGGMLVVPVFYFVFKLPEKVSHATALFVILPLSVVGCVVYIIKGGIWDINLLYTSVGFILGGILGAILLKKTSNKTIRIIFASVMLIAVLRLLF